MSKRMPQKAGWIFVVVFVGLHLLYCALDLKRCLMVVGPYDNTETALYQLVEQASAFLRFFWQVPVLYRSTQARSGRGILPAPA